MNNTLNRNRTFALLGAGAILSGLAVLWLSAAQAWDRAAAPPQTAGIYTFKGPGKVSPMIESVVERHAGRVDWSPQGWIAMDSRRDGDGHQIWIFRPDGSARRPLTGSHPQVGTFSNGNPAWHPNGRLIVFQAADAAAPPRLQNLPNWALLASPGAGLGNNLWLIESDGGRAWPLTRLRVDQGVLHAHFSHRGDRLIWAEMVESRPQRWVMRLADFAFDEASGPRLSNRRTISPGDLAFYETHSFLPDDSGFLYSATARPNEYHNLEIYRFDLASGREIRLTDPAAGAWDEHAHVSPDGRRIVWMSSRGIPQQTETRGGQAVRADYWIMNADGGGQTRLTYFNEPGAPEFRASWNIASDVAWSPDGRSVMGYLQQITARVGRSEFPATLVRIEVPDADDTDR